MDGELNLKKNFTEASGPSNELVLKVLKESPKGLKVVPLICQAK